MLLDAILKGERSSRTASAAFHELHVKFEFKPSSEKQKKTGPIVSDIVSEENLNKIAKQSKKLKLKVEDVDLECKERNNKDIADLEDFEDSVEQEFGDDEIDIDDENTSEEDKERDRQRDIKHDEYFNRMLNTGNGPDKKFLNTNGTIFPANVLSMNLINLDFTNSKGVIEREFGINSKGLQKEKLASVKYDFNLQLIAFEGSHETIRDPIAGKTISAAPPELNLKGFQVTLRAMVNLVIMTVIFLIPMHRISRILGNVKIFNRSNIARYLGIVAEKLLPIYFHLFDTLANVKYMSADATPTRVNEKLGYCCETKSKKISKSKTRLWSLMVESTLMTRKAQLFFIAPA